MLTRVAEFLTLALMFGVFWLGWVALP